MEEENVVPDPAPAAAVMLDKASMLSKYLNPGEASKPVTFEHDGDLIRLRVPTVAEWSATFNDVFKQRKDDGIYVDLAHQKRVALQLVIDEDGEQVFDERTSKTLLQSKVGSPVDRLAARCVKEMEKIAGKDEEGKSGSGSATT